MRLVSPCWTGVVGATEKRLDQQSPNTPRLYLLGDRLILKPQVQFDCQVFFLNAVRVLLRKYRFTLCFRAWIENSTTDRKRVVLFHIIPWQDNVKYKLSSNKETKLFCFCKTWGSRHQNCAVKGCLKVILWADSNAYVLKFIYTVQDWVHSKPCVLYLIKDTKSTKSSLTWTHLIPYKRRSFPGLLT